MEGFVARENIEHYREMLKIATDPEQRRLLKRLLSEAEAALRKYEQDRKRK
jgi:hypothetical protein